MRTIILAAMFAMAQFIFPAAAAENLKWEDGNVGVYAEYSRYIPEDADETLCGGNCARVESGNGFRFGGLYRFPDIPVAAEASLLLATGDVKFGGSATNLSDAGDWEVTHKMLGFRLSPTLDGNFHFSAGAGLSLWDVSLDEFYVPDDDGTDAYFTAYGGWKFAHVSWFHADGDNAFGLGATIWL